MKTKIILLLFTVLSLASCSKEFKEKAVEVPESEAGTWYEVMTNGDHFESLNIDESGRLTGSFYIHDYGRSYEFAGIHTKDKMILHLYRNPSDKSDYIDKIFTIVKFDNSELVLANFFKGFFFTRDSSKNPYPDKPTIPQLLGKWEYVQPNGSKCYYYFYGNGTGKYDFKSTNEAFNECNDFSHWFTINDWLFIKQTPRDPSYNRYAVYKYRFEGDNMLLYSIDLSGDLDKKFYKYVRLESFPSVQGNTGDSASSTSYDESYSNSAEAQSEESHREERQKHTTSVPVQVWKQCVNCFGSGQCQFCYGQGHQINMYGNDQDCPVCTDGRCTICAGQGGHYETEYQTRVDYY